MSFRASTRRCCWLFVFAILAGVSPARASDLRGEGVWESRSEPSISGKWLAQLTRVGDRLEGTVILTGSNVFSGGAATGRIVGTTISLGILAQGSKQATFQGRLDGEQVRGDWASDVVVDDGMWYGTLKTDQGDSK